jgi:hypothetical protein
MFSPLATSNRTLYVSSASQVAVSAQIFDQESGIFASKISLRLNGQPPGAQPSVVLNGLANVDALLDLKRYSLIHNARYVVALEAIDMAGLTTAVEAFLHIDDSPPVPGRVLEGLQDDIIHVHCHDSIRVIWVNWTPFFDNETEVTYQVAASTNRFDSSAQDLAPFGSPLHVLRAQLELVGHASEAMRSGHTMFVSVKATNVAGLSSFSTSLPLKIKCRTESCSCSDMICF